MHKETASAFVEAPALDQEYQREFDKYANDPKLAAALQYAVAQCQSATFEEEGGFILELDGMFKFEKLKNANTGTPIARTLWTADANEMAEKVIAKAADGWKVFASFHTHPQFPPIPSQIDLRQLFQGYKHNFIYSPVTKEVIHFVWNTKSGADELMGAVYNFN